MSRRNKTLLWGAVPVVALGVLLSIPSIPGTDISLTVPYAAQGPGPTFDTLAEVEGTPVVEIAGAEVDETSGHLNMTTVAVRTEMTLPQFLGRWAFSGDTIVPIEEVIPPNRSSEEVAELNKAAFSASEANATIAALRHLGRPVETEVKETMPDTPASALLQPGDLIRAVDGKTVATPNEVQKEMASRDPGESITMRVTRGGEDLDIPVTLAANPDDESKALLGIYMRSAAADGVDVTYHLEDIGGPSAGLMFSLAVVDKLSPGALNEGKFVAGTGTITEAGEVGPIGGIQHKVTAAADAGAELFLAPAANCAEAARGDAKDMQIVAVDSLDDAIAQMRNFATGGELKRCSG